MNHQERDYLDAITAERDEALKWRHMHDAAAKDWREELERRETAEAEVSRLNHEHGALEAETRTLREALLAWWEPEFLGQRHVGQCVCRACTLTRTALTREEGT